MTYPNPPRALKKAGKAIWKKGQALWDRGVLTEDYLDTWQLYCRLWDDLAEIDSFLDGKERYKETAQGVFIEHPAIKRREKIEISIRRYAQLFGQAPYSPRRTGNPSAQPRSVASRQK